MVKELDNFRAKYPDYNDVDDVKLAGMLANKFPDAYGDLPDIVKIITEIPDTMVSSRQAGIESIRPEGTEISKPFEKVAGLKLGYEPGDGMPRPGAGIVGAAAETILPVGGALIGAAAAGGPTMGAGAISGSGLGFAIGENAAQKTKEFLGLEKPRPIIEQSIEAGKDVLKGSTMEIGSLIAMPIIGKAFDKTAKLLFDDLPQRLYSSAIKMPLTKSWKKVLPGQEITKRTAAVKEGISNSITPSEFGLAKTKKLERETRTFIDSVTKKLSENPELDIKVADVLKNSLDALYKQTKGSDPVGANSAIDAVKEAFKAHGERLTPHEANAIKRRLYDEIKWSEMNRDSGHAVSGIYTNKAKKAIANDLMRQIEVMYPEIKGMNQADAARIYLTEAVENSLGRLQNNNMVPLGVKVLLSNPRTWIPAMFEATIGHPQIKSRIAFALAKGNPNKYSKLVYPEMPKGYVPEPIEKASEVYRYSPEPQFAKAPLPGQLKTITREGEPASSIKNKMQAAREAEDLEKLRQLEIQFGRIEKEKNAVKDSKIGSPLTKPRDFVGVKAPLPGQLKTITLEGEPAINIENKADRTARLMEEKRIREAEIIKAREAKELPKDNKIGMPLRKPDTGYYKSKKPLSVDALLKQTTGSGLPENNILAIDEVMLFEPVMPPIGEIKPEKIKVTENKITVNIPKKEADGLTPKQQKEYLLKETDSAISQAKTQRRDLGYSKDTEMVNKNYEDAKKTQGTINIKVPGDGEFTILNNAESLKAFKQKAEKFPVTSLTGKANTSLPTKPTGKRVTGFEGYHITDYKVRKSPGVIEKKGKASFYGDGFFSSGTYAIKTDKPKVKGKIEVSPYDMKGKFDITSKELVAADIGKEAYLGAEIGMDDVLVHIKSGKKERMFNTKYIDNILSKYPKAKAFFSGKDGDYMVYFVDKGETVGVVAPYNADIPQAIKNLE